MQEKDQLARGMVESLLSYGMGREIEFTDHDAVEVIVEQLRARNFRMQDMIQAIAASPIFQQK